MNDDDWYAMLANDFNGNRFTYPIISSHDMNFFLRGLAGVYTTSVPSVSELLQGGLFAIFIPIENLQQGHWIGLSVSKDISTSGENLYVNIFDPLGMMARDGY